MYTSKYVPGIYVCSECKYRTGISNKQNVCPQCGNSTLHKVS